MILKFKNDKEDVEALLEYTYLYLIWWKIYNITLSVIGIVTPAIIVINVIRTDSNFLNYIFISSIFILFMIVLTFFAVYLFFNIMPKLIIKRLKKLSYKYYRDKELFSSEKIIVLKDRCIEVTYNDKSLNIPLNKNILIDQFKGYIIISSVFMNNKIKKIYPLVIPFNIFESKENKEEFIKEIEEKKMLL